MKLLHTLLFTLVLIFSSSAMSAQAQAEKININTANAEQIATTMTGIGDNKAKAIVEYRRLTVSLNRYRTWKTSMESV